MPIVEVAEFVFDVVFALLIAGLVLWFMLVSQYLSYLREKHSTTFKSIGSPHLFLNNTPRNNINFFKYVWSEQCNGTHDLQLIKMTRTLRFIFIGYSVLFLSLILAVATIELSS